LKRPSLDLEKVAKAVGWAAAGGFASLVLVDRHPHIAPLLTSLYAGLVAGVGLMALAERRREEKPLEVFR